MNELKYKPIKFIVLALLFFITNLAVAQTDYCSFNTLGGERNIDYNEFYTDLVDYHSSYKNESNTFLKNLYIESAKNLITTCTDFYQRIQKDEIPEVDISTGNDIGDRIAAELLKRANGYQDALSTLRKEHPNLKRWLRSLNP